jgi:sporulation protein YlmC with PRC-barrel domain
MLHVAIIGRAPQGGIDMRKIMTVFMICFTIGLVSGYTEITAEETAKQELNDQQVQQITQEKIYYSKFVGFAGRDADGDFDNEINQMEPGEVFITRNGVIHKGKTNYLIPWQKVKKITRNTLGGSGSSILIRTPESSEKLELVDPKRTGNMNTLDTSMDTLLRRLKKTFRRYRRNPESYASTIPEVTAPVPDTTVPTPETPTEPIAPKVAVSEPATPETPTTPMVKLPPKKSQPPMPVIKKKLIETKEPPKKEETKEIKVGMTYKEIEAALGSPLKKVTLADKVIYQYKDIVITFKDGKMTDAVVK